MTISIISFTKKGFELSCSLNEGLANEGIIYAKEKYITRENKNIHSFEGSLNEWTFNHFHEDNILIFIGACQIAVRSIAPFIKSKDTDPAVIAVDELGKYAICLLSGHLGGGNIMTKRIATAIGALPVITTATDINNIFAVDTFAKRNNLIITDIKDIKNISARLLNGEEVYCYYDKRYINLCKDVPKGIVLDGVENRYDGIVITHTVKKQGAITLIPKQVYIGIGCRKNINPQELREFVMSVLEEENVHPLSIKAVCSIDIKAKEEAIIAFGDYLKVEILTFNKDILNRQKGDYSASEFVKSVTGVDNVCERAVVAAGCDTILVRKRKFNGMTLAVGIRKEDIYFE